MSCCDLRQNGRIAGGGRSSPISSAFFQTTFTQIGATLGTINIATLATPGDRILLRGLELSAIFTAGVPAGDIGQIAYGGAVQCQNATTDAQVVLFGPQPWGPPPTPVLQPTSTGYQPPLAFANPGGIAVGAGIVGTNVVVVGLGIAGFTTRFDLVGEIYLFGGAVRLV